MVSRIGSTVRIDENFLDGFKLAPDEDRAQRWDDKLPGFGVIVGKRRISFVVFRRIKGQRQKTMTVLGHWAPSKLRALDAGVRDATITVAIARGKAIEALGAMRGGEDPRGEDAPSARAANGPTLRAGLELHVANMKKKGCSERSIDTIETEVPRLLADWLDRPIAELTGAQLATIHDTLTSEDPVTGETRPYLANRIVAQVSAIWNALDKRHELEGRNPARAVTRNKYTPKRERVDDTKLPEWFVKVQTIAPVRRDLQLFAIATGMRSESARHVRWEHIDFKTGALVVPKPKGGEAKAFTLPLGPRTIAMLRKRKTQNATEFSSWGGDHGWVFPSLSRSAPFVVQPIAESKQYTQTGGRGGPKTKYLPGLHALRRTYLSVATEAGIGELDRHALANHAYGRQSVNATYIAQAFDHLANCQRKIEDALWSRFESKASKGAKRSAQKSKRPRRAAAA